MKMKCNKIIAKLKFVHVLETALESSIAKPKFPGRENLSLEFGAESWSRKALPKSLNSIPVDNFLTFCQETPSIVTRF